MAKTIRYNPDNAPIKAKPIFDPKFGANYTNYLSNKMAKLSNKKTSSICAKAA